jgi:hypothetical protein
MPLKSGLHHTKVFEVAVEEFCKGFRYDKALNNGYAAFLEKMLFQMPEIRSFQ